MNAGAYGGEMKDVVLKVNHIDKKGNVGCLFGEDLDFSYRHSAYSDSDLIITSVVLKLQKGNPSEIEAHMTDVMGRRVDKQPLEYPSAGSVFKRPEGYFAGALIEQSGLKGKRIGGAMVSEKHAGFVVNLGGAKAEDVKQLLSDVADIVYVDTGIHLEPEVRIW